MCPGASRLWPRTATSALRPEQPVQQRGEGLGADDTCTPLQKGKCGNICLSPILACSGTGPATVLGLCRSDFLLHTPWTQQSILAFTTCLLPARLSPSCSVCGSRLRPSVGKITLSQSAAAITFPAFPRVPHLLSKLRKYPVRLN